MNKLFSQVYSGSSSILNDAEKKMILDNGGNDTYGEILPDSLDTLLSAVGFTSDTLFYDLGSGMGKVVLHVALRTGAKSVGFELSTTRYTKAMSALSRVSSAYPHIEGLVQFRNQNLLDFANEDLGGNPCLVFTCSTCFNRELMDSIRKMTKKKGVSVLTLVRFSNEEPNVTFSNIPMTWSSNGVNVYYYK